MDAAVDDEPGSSVPEKRPTPQNLSTFVPYACRTFGFTFSVKIEVETQAKYIRKSEYKKAPQPTRQLQHRTTVIPEELESDDITDGLSSDDLAVVITAVQDTGGNLLELVFNHCIEIPRQLIKVIGMCVPYQHKLYRLTVRRTPLTSVVLYEISKWVSHLTEICLDDSPVAGRIYEVLLQQPFSLHYLSLSRCKLDDKDCALLAASLAPPGPAATSLRVLLLASNEIGDEGARAFANILRSNRGLNYLNLAGNHITDSGAISIFKSLMEFSLTTDELRATRLRHIEFFRRRSDVYANFIKELTQGKSPYDIRVSKRKQYRLPKSNGQAGLSASNLILQKAEAMTDEVMGTFTDPFSCDHTMKRGKELYCIGNLALCGLNLSYNNLEYSSVTWLCTLLTHQSWVQGPKASRTSPGLLRVRIDGNNLPLYCDEFLLINDLLERAVTRRSRPLTVNRPTRTKSKSLLITAKSV